MPRERAGLFSETSNFAFIDNPSNWFADVPARRILPRASENFLRRGAKPITPLNALLPRLLGELDCIFALSEPPVSLFTPFINSSTP
jgi:hypothetical protein